MVQTCGAIEAGLFMVHDLCKQIRKKGMDYQLKWLLEVCGF